MRVRASVAQTIPTIVLGVMKFETPFLCPVFGVQYKCESYLEQANEIFLIGYRAQDDIIKQIFKAIPKYSLYNPRKKLHVVGIDDSDIIMESALKLSDNLEQGNIYKSGFMTFAREYLNM
jgi:hypothetical protein